MRNSPLSYCHIVDELYFIVLREYSLQNIQDWTEDDAL